MPQFADLLVLDDELGRALARHALAAARKPREDFAVPEADYAFAKEPAVANLDELVFVISRKAQRVRRLAVTFSDECE